MENKKETKKTKAPTKINSEVETLTKLLAEKEAVNAKLLDQVKFLEYQLQEHYEAVAALYDEVELYKNASFFTKLNNLFRK